MGNLTAKPLSWFKIDPNQPRKSFDEEAACESMKAQSQLQPVGARPDGRLLWGERRYQAAKLLLSHRDDAFRGKLERMDANIIIRRHLLKKQRKSIAALRTRRLAWRRPR